jgi:hypothetical protein
MMGHTHRKRGTFHHVTHYIPNRAKMAIEAESRHYLKIVTKAEIHGMQNMYNH